jgi:hypothetical protein
LSKFNGEKSFFSESPGIDIKSFVQFFPQYGCSGKNVRRWLKQGEEIAASPGTPLTWEARRRLPRRRKPS